MNSYHHYTNTVLVGLSLNQQIFIECLFIFEVNFKQREGWFINLVSLGLNVVRSVDIVDINLILPSLLALSVFPEGTKEAN